VYNKIIYCQKIYVDFLYSIIKFQKIFWQGLLVGDIRIGFAGTVAEGSLALTPTPLPEGEGLGKTFSLALTPTPSFRGRGAWKHLLFGWKLVVRYSANLPLSLWERGQG